MTCRTPLCAAVQLLAACVHYRGIKTKKATTSTTCRRQLRPETPTCGQFMHGRYNELLFYYCYHFETNYI